MPDRPPTRSCLAAVATAEQLLAASRAGACGFVPSPDSVSFALPHAATGAEVLARNLAAIRVSSPKAAEEIQAACPLDGIDFFVADDGLLAARLRNVPEVDSPDRHAALPNAKPSPRSVRGLCSARKPAAEAAALAATVDLTQIAAVVVGGFGVGHHVAELARRMRRTGVIVVFEPDARLLRAVLERIDCSAWIAATNLLLITGAVDEAALAEALHPLEGVLAMGVRLLEHPPSAPRLGKAAAQFAAGFARVMESVRTSVATTLVQTHTTMRNLTQNLDHYALGAGIADLKDAAQGRAAVVVSAGPSLRRNVALLKSPGVRAGVVIIAAQTVLKPLLAEGIRPHFVCALDYHEISARFYEGLTAADVEGITLIVEAKVNPAVTSAFPGLIRCAQDSWLDEIIGPDLMRPMGTLPAGATVAHLCYEFARFLGCDPAILIGQDLGFTDGSYYAPGAAIHSVWAAELNDLCTLETLEWQRIVRHRGTLRARTDQRGRALYTDDQMEAYLLQFERAFARDAALGLRVIDATEGGVAKLHAPAMRLREALAVYAAPACGAQSANPPAPITDVLHGIAASGAGGPDGVRVARRQLLTARLDALHVQAGEVATLCEQAEALLSQMEEHAADRARVDALITRVHAVAADVQKLEPVYSIVHRLNQTGAYNRMRTDRSIYNDGALSPVEVQRRQMTRDRTNVRWLRDAARALETMLTQASVALRTGIKVTRESTPQAAADALGGPNASGIALSAPATIANVVLFRARESAWGDPIDPCAPIFGAMAPLEITLRRLQRGPARRTLVIVEHPSDVTCARRAAGASAGAAEFIVADGRTARYAPAVLRAYRAHAAHAWRGGPLCVFDELIDLGVLARVLEAQGLSAAVLLASDWCCVDAALADALCARYYEDPRGHRFTFTQAGPGLAPCLVDLALARQLAACQSTAGPFASLGGALAYVPVAPIADLIARSVCVSVEPVVRDTAQRAIADTPAQFGRLAQALAEAGVDVLTAGAQQIAQALLQTFSSDASTATVSATRPSIVAVNSPESTTLDLAALGFEAAAALIESFTRSAHVAGRRAILTLRDDDETFARLADLLTLARATFPGVIHLRSRFARGTIAPTFLCGDEASPPLVDIISVDLVADRCETYAALAPALGASGWQASRAMLQTLVAARRPPRDSDGSGILVPFIVSRIERRDATLDQIEAVVDGATMMAGWAVVDPPVCADRIEPMPLPALAARRRALLHLGGVTPGVRS
ncbi:hypothetical protein BH11PLA1_BH11PLA1_07840 [soil metagenome]